MGLKLFPEERIYIWHNILTQKPVADQFMGLSKPCATTVFLNGNVVQIPSKYYVYNYKLLKLSALGRVAQSDGIS